VDAVADLPFRFDAGNHEYLNLLTGEVFPHITGMLEQTGWIDDRWYTEESSTRGTVVHRLTAEHDLGAELPENAGGLYRGYFLAYVQAIGLLRPTFHEVEIPHVHPYYRFGGRPDRRVTIAARKGVLEIKTGAPEKSHQIQTALQALLVARQFHLPPELLQRTCLYVKADGKFTLLEHVRRRDFDEARDVIRVCCRV